MVAYSPDFQLLLTLLLGLLRAPLILVLSPSAAISLSLSILQQGGLATVLYSAVCSFDYIAIVVSSISKVSKITFIHINPFFSTEFS